MKGRGSAKVLFLLKNMGHELPQAVFCQGYSFLDLKGMCMHYSQELGLKI